MNADRFHVLTSRYRQLRIGVIGDFCLDRYLEIDPGRTEISIETSLPVYNVTRVRSQPGAAGTILNNLVALGVGEIHAVGFCGNDGEGYELRRALACLPGVRLDHFLSSDDRRTFVYCKPLVMEPNGPPRELNRLDSKNWTPTPAPLRQELAARIRDLVPRLDGVILMDQVDLAETGVVTRTIREAVYAACTANPNLHVLADSRRGLADFPALGFKMNAAELGKLTGTQPSDVEEVKRLAGQLAERNRRSVFVTLSERGIVGALPGQPPEHIPALPVRGPIDIVGAGDSVTANLITALAAGATLQEAMRLAMAAASCVIHQLGTTGTASPGQLQELV